ncbi:hypothetical protein Mapa_012606 [Marchantia paleacea]|nr:hypothetical protein Mapa_012606 [Marchantia paleacea]
MWGFLSSVLRGKADGCSSSNVASAEKDFSEEAFEDCLEEHPEVSCLPGYAAQKVAVSSIFPPLSTRAAQVAPSRNRTTDQERAGIPFTNSVGHFESPSAPSPFELNLRPCERWNFAADVRSTDISPSQESWLESSCSSAQVLNRGLLVGAPGDCHGSNASCTNSQIHRVPTALDEFTSADRRSCAFLSTPPRVVDGQPLSWPVVSNGPGSPENSFQTGVVVRPSPWRNVKCGVRAGATDALHPVGEDWSSFHELLDATRRFEDGVDTPPPYSTDGEISHSSIATSVPSPWRNVKCGVRAGATDALHPIGGDWSSFHELLDATRRSEDGVDTPPPYSTDGTSGGTFLEARSPNQTCYSSTADILPSQISLGAFPLTNSPNCTVDRDSRQLSQLRYPQQQQGVNESSEKTAFDPVSSFGNISLDPQSEERRQRQSHGGRSVQWPQLTEHLSVLGKFDFSTKVFPVFATLRGNTSEVFFTAEELHERGGVPKEEVSHYLWYLDGLHCRPTTRRPPKRNAGTASFCKFFVYRSGKVSFQIMEEKNQASTLLQRVLGFDRVLKEYFEDGHQEHGRSRQVTRAQGETYHRLAEREIFAGLRRYMYFAHKPSDKAEHKSEGNVKCYFVCTESRADADLQDPQLRQFSTIAKARCLFMHIHRTNSLFKYISRLQLMLSKTIIVNLDWSVVTVGDLDDVRCKDAYGQELQGVCTDGTGYISRDLAEQIATDVYQGKRLKKRSSNELGNELPPNTIMCFKSMEKVGRDDRMKNYSLTSLDLVSTSRNTSGRAKMSQDLIVLLSPRKVLEYFFIKHLTAAVEKSYMIFKDPRAALEELLDWENDKADLLTDMISAIISLQEPFLHKSLLYASKSKLQDFSNGKFALDGSHYLMGTADPRATLKRNQVAITLSEGQVYCSKVLVYRAPGKHPGDIHVFQATCNELLDAIIGTGKSVMYFSTQGSRPITEEIGKGDLGGDMYWVCKNAELVSYVQEWHCRWERTATKSVCCTPKPTDFSPPELERALFERFLQARFNTTSLVGIIANRWLKHMDEYLHTRDEHWGKKRAHLEAALELITPHYDSLDYAKTGTKPRVPDEEWPARRPHYMEKNGRQPEGYGVNLKSYHAESILGKIYDQAISTEHEWSIPTFDNFEVDVGFQFANHELHIKRWLQHFTSYRGEMTSALKTKATGSLKFTYPEKIYLKYRKILYGGVASFRDAEVLGKKERQLILEEASAIYTVVYETGKYYVSRRWEPKLSFAWNVAGEALCEVYSKRQPGRSLHMSFGYFCS